MSKNTLLVVLAGAGSALIWWPASIDPSIDFSRWTLLALVALMTGLSIILSNGGWLRFVVASVVGTLAGLCSGSAIWPSDDVIANTYLGFVVAGATLAILLVSLVVGFAVRKVSVRNEKVRCAMWFALACCCAFGPIALALTPPVVVHRMARNDRLASERFESLKTAVEQTMAEAGGPGRICDGQALRRHYSGPSFSEEDWRRIDYKTGDRATENGYVYEIHCREQGGYAIGAWPIRLKGYGTRRFCTDQSGKVGCDLMPRSPSRYVCHACTE
jgi:hypothetical protein